MSRTIPATPRYAARSSVRIDLIPSRRVAFAWLAWVAMACAATLAAPLPLLARLAICVGVATAAIRSVATVVLLRGPRAVHGLEWNVKGELRAFLGRAANPIPVRPAAGSFRLGPGILFLRLETARGIHNVCIDGYLHDPAAFRGLCRCLRRPAGTGSGRDSRGS